jgi:hypothetical protein
MFACCMKYYNVHIDFSVHACKHIIKKQMNISKLYTLLIFYSKV